MIYSSSLQPCPICRIQDVHFLSHLPKFGDGVLPQTVKVLIHLIKVMTLSENLIKVLINIVVIIKAKHDDKVDDDDDVK